MIDTPAESIAKFQQEAHEVAEKLCLQLEGTTTAITGMALTEVARVFLVRAHLENGKGAMALEMFMFGVRLMGEQAIRELDAMSEAERKALIEKATTNTQH